MKCYIYVKPVLDFTLALILLAFFSPLLLIVAIWIKLSSKGPVFFKQERLGKNGRVFKIYKFRTMVDNAINIGSGLRTDANDPRITKVGRFLRKTSLDELPQLINVLRGEMSFIGPRPPVPYHPYKYENYDETQKQRFSLKPGISGYAQIKVRNNATWDERIVYDVEYVKRIGFLFDLYIFFATPCVTVFRKNIYSADKIKQKSIPHQERQGKRENEKRGNDV